jgi:hypothetical protein
MREFIKGFATALVLACGLTAAGAAGFAFIRPHDVIKAWR